MPQTRSATKRAAGAALLSDNSANPGKKRPVNTNQAQDKKHRTKRAKNQTQPPISPTQPNTVILPHGLGAVPQPATLIDDDRKPSSRFSATTVGTEKMTLEELKKAAKPRGLPKETPDNKYRLMPGATPFPDWSRPTPEECQIVYDILVEEYEEKKKAREENDGQSEGGGADQETDTQPKKSAPLSFTPPAKIQPPSTTVAGCGEVPDLVDAMMRTLISQSVTRDSANMVVERIIARFGQLDPQGIGAASINWNAVRMAPPEDVIETLHKGGLQNRKYEGIKGCLDMIYKENQVRRCAYMKEKETGEVANVPGAAEMTAGQKEHQLKKIEAEILTLDHIRAMPADDAMMALIKHPQIGVKTAACLLLFCLQMPSFAVDTHVYRMCRWLYWVPGTENENYVYMHCDLRVPGHLKYGLHQLFIEHGSECHRCKGNTSKGTAEWDKAVCPLEHLLDRYGKKESKSKTANAADIEKNGGEAHEAFEGPVDAEAVVEKKTPVAIANNEEGSDCHCPEEPLSDSPPDKADEEASLSDVSQGPKVGDK